MIGNLAARALLGLLWALHFLPLAVLAALGQGLGRLLWWTARKRRHIALRNLALCMPDKPEAERRDIASAHFGWVARSMLERSVLWYASPARLKRLIRVEGDVQFAARDGGPVMWLVPHFVGLDVAGVSTQLFQPRLVGSIYQRQSNEVFDAAIRAGRLRFDQGEVFSRHEKALPLVRAIRRGYVFFNLPDMDFGAAEAAFVPFFGVKAATLMAPSKMARALKMKVQPIVTEVLPGGRGYVVRYLEPWTDWPTDDPVADAARMNLWIESEARKLPAQYLWVHKRFKTRPEGEGGVY